MRYVYIGEHPKIEAHIKVGNSLKWFSMERNIPIELPENVHINTPLIIKENEWKLSEVKTEKIKKNKKLEVEENDKI